MTKEYSRRHILEWLIGLGVSGGIVGGLLSLSKCNDGRFIYSMSGAVEGLFINSDPSKSVHHKLIKTTNVKEGDMILDVGCGELPYLDLETRTDYRIVGLDISKEMLERAEKKGAILLDDKTFYSRDYLLKMINKYQNNRLLIHGDARSLPFENNSFDAVISKDLLQYVLNYEKAVEEMYRVIKPGRGTAIMITSLEGMVRLNKVKQILKNLGSYDAENSLELISQKKKELKDGMRASKKNFLYGCIIDIGIALEIFDKEGKNELKEIRKQALPPYVYGTKPI